MTEKNQKLLAQVGVAKELVDFIQADKENDVGLREAALHANIGLMKLELELQGYKEWRNGLRV